MPAAENFCRNLRAIMDARGLTLREVAERAETSHPYVHGVLQGKTKVSIKSAEKLAHAVESSLTDLLAEPRKFQEALDRLVSA